MEDHLRRHIGEQPGQVGFDDVGLDELEAVVPFGLTEILAATGAEIVDPDDRVPV